MCSCSQQQLGQVLVQRFDHLQSERTALCRIVGRKIQCGNFILVLLKVTDKDLVRRLRLPLGDELRSLCAGLLFADG